MFEIGFSEIVLVLIVGLIVLGPERLPVAVKTVAGWIRAMRSLASSVQNELTQELKLQELQDSIKKVEKNALQDLSPELKASMDELRAAAQAMQKTYQEPDAAAKPAIANGAEGDAPSADKADDAVRQAEEHDINGGVSEVSNPLAEAAAPAEGASQSGNNR